MAQAHNSSGLVVTWGTVLAHKPPETKENCRRRILGIVKKQVACGGIALLIAEDKHWPALSRGLPQPGSVQSVFTCALENCGCFAFKIWTFPHNEQILTCCCGQRGSSSLSTPMYPVNVIRRLLGYLFQNLEGFRRKTGSDVAGGKPSATTASNPSGEIQDLDNAYPTEQALRQKESRKARKLALEEGGRRTYEVWRLLYTSVQEGLQKK